MIFDTPPKNTWFGWNRETDEIFPLETYDAIRVAFEDGSRIVEQTKVGDYLVSTVFLGLDHSFGFSRPLYFETMIFMNGPDFETAMERFRQGRADENPFQYYQVRYETSAEAKAGHEEAIDFLKASLEETKKTDAGKE